MSKRKNLELIEDLTEIVKTQGERIDTLQKALDTVLERNPQLAKQDRPKTLDQSVFDDKDEKWRWAAVDENSKAFLFSKKPECLTKEWYAEEIYDHTIIGVCYDASNWQNSLIEREAKPLDGNERIKKLLERQKVVLAKASGESYEHALTDGFYIACIDFENDDYPIDGGDGMWSYAVPIDNNGNEILDVE